MSFETIQTEQSPPWYLFRRVFATNVADTSSQEFKTTYESRGKRKGRKRKTRERTRDIWRLSFPPRLSVRCPRNYRIHLDVVRRGWKSFGGRSLVDTKSSENVPFRRENEREREREAGQETRWTGSSVCFYPRRTAGLFARILIGSSLSLPLSLFLVDTSLETERETPFRVPWGDLTRLWETFYAPRTSSSRDATLDEPVVSLWPADPRLFALKRLGGVWNFQENRCFCFVLKL